MKLRDAFSPIQAHQRTGEIGKSSVMALVGLVLCALLAILLYPMLVPVRMPTGNGGRGSSDSAITPFSKQAAEKAIYSAAILENNQFDEAIENYRGLAREYPDHPQCKKNLAIAYIAKLQQQIEFLSNTNYDPKVIRDGLPDLLDNTTEALKNAMQGDRDRADICRLDSILRSKRARLLDPILAFDEYFDTYDKLKEYVAEFPTNISLLYELDQAAESIIAVEPKVGAELIEPLWNGYRAHPRNLAMLCLLMSRLEKQHDARLLELVPALLELLRPFEWYLSLEGNQLSQLASTIELGKSDPERAMSLIGQWRNLAVKTQGHKADIRNTNSNVLASIDLSDAQAYIATQSETSTLSTPTFESVGSGLPAASGAQCIDWNLDSKMDLLSWQGNRLAIGSLSDTFAYSEQSSLELPFPIVGICLIDLFRVNSGVRLKVPGRLEPQHDALRDVLVYGPGGIAIVSFASVEGPPKLMLAPSTIEVKGQVREIGLSGLANVTCVIPLDWDADSDLDLACIADGKLILKQNNGNRTFLDVGQFSAMPDDGWIVTAAAAVDYDRDVDIDIVLSGPTGVAVMENILHGQFQFRVLEPKWNSLQSATALAVGDLDNNYSWDFVSESVDGVHSQTTSTLSSSVVAPRMAWHSEGVEGHLTLGDWNNDGFIDAVSASKINLRLLINRGNGDFASVEFQGGQNFEGPVTKVDLDGDGKLDLITICDGSVKILHNTTNNDHHYSVVRLKGISDENGGGDVNHYAIGSTIEVYSSNAYQARIVEDAITHFGLGTNKPFTARIIFPNGLTQNIILPTVDTMIEEKQVPKGSCPFLYGWDGQAWGLVTDLLWNAPLGLQIAKGKPIPDRRWEYLLIPGSRLQPQGDTIELRLTEELWEAAYFDQVSLRVIDHPKETQVYSNEKVGPASIAQPGIWMVQDALPLRSAVDKYQRNWTSALADEDRIFAVPFESFVCQGIVETHWTELDFGQIDVDRKAQLYLTGWIYPTNTSINIGVDQNPDVDGAQPPSLWTVGTDGEFHPSIPFTGFPGGKPKTIVIPLDGLFATDDHRIRLQHSSEIYWDRAVVGYGEMAPITRAQQLVMESAELHYRGFSAEMPRRRSEPHWYDYGRTLREPQWPPMNGSFTRYGSVTELIELDDDRLVVMGAGDEMRIRFKAPTAVLPYGWVRDYVLYNVGWDKDADLNTLDGQSSLPLPFSTMRSYPPLHPSDRAREREIESMHRETLTREQSFEGFWRPHVDSGATPQ